MQFGEVQCIHLNAFWSFAEFPRSPDREMGKNEIRFNLRQKCQARGFHPGVEVFVYISCKKDYSEKW